ncbi:hypothetical protein Bca4012_010696 [Brassica carinata]
MTKTNRDELKSTNNSELSLMAKGSQSSTRRDEKAIVRVADSDVENKEKSSSGTVAKESEPGKSSGRRGTSEHRQKINHVPKLNPKNDSSGHDFSGIAILADAACDLSNDLAPAVDRLPAEEPVVQQQDVLTILPHAVDSKDQVGQGKNDTVQQQDVSTILPHAVDLADEKGTEHIIASVGGMVVATEVVSESKKLAPDSGVVIKSEKSSASEPTKKKNLRLHWDLNVSMDAWGPPCDVEDDVSEKDVNRAITKPMPPRESEPIDGSKDHLDGFVVPAAQEKFSSTCGPKAEAAARNGNEFKSGYNSPLEDGELREPYRLGENKVEDGETESGDEGFYPMAESKDNKMKDAGKGILEGTKLGQLKCKSHDALRIGEAHDRRNIEKNVGACMNDLHLKKRSSSSSRRSDDYEELSVDPYKSFGRHDRSSSRGHFSGSGSRPRNVFEPPRPDERGMVGGFDQSGSRSGQGSQPDGHVHNRFSNGGYRGGQFRRFSNGGDRVSRGRHGNNNQFSGRMHNWMSGNRRERGNSPVFRRSRSRSPVPWTGRDIVSPPHDGLRAEERMMERARFPFQNRFLEDQEIGFVSPSRNRMPSPRFIERRSYDSGANHNSFRERRFGLGQRHDAGSSVRRLNSDNSNNFVTFRRQRTFDSVEDSTGGNRFEMRQQQTRRADVTDDGGDDVRRFRFHRKESVGVSQQQQQRR